MITIHSTGIARIRHNTTGEIFEIEAEELGWDIMGSEERQMGPENSYIAVVEHPELGQLSWSLWEYPLGMENDTETDVGPHELLENIRFGLQHLPNDDDREDYEPPPLPLPMRLEIWKASNLHLVRDYQSTYDLIKVRHPRPVAGSDVSRIEYTDRQ